MSRGRGYRERWRAEVIRSTLIPDSVRVLLLVLADTMTDAGYVSVPRSLLAEQLARAPRRITERIDAARQAGFLDVLRSGRPGRTAEYVAVIPSRGMVRPSAPCDCGPQGYPHGADCSHHSWRPSAPSKSDTHGADGGPTNARAYLRDTATELPPQSPVRPVLRLISSRLIDADINHQSTTHSEEPCCAIA